MSSVCIWSGFTVLLENLPVLSAFVSAESKSDVFGAAVTTPGPARPVPFATGSHITRSTFSLSESYGSAEFKGVASVHASDIVGTVTGSVVSTVTVSGSCHCSDAARDRASAKVGPSAIVVTWVFVTVGAFSLVRDSWVLAAEGSDSGFGASVASGRALSPSAPCTPGSLFTTLDWFVLSAENGPVGSVVWKLVWCTVGIDQVGVARVRNGVVDDTRTGGGIWR